MHSKRSRLDRFISTRIGINRRDVRLILAQGRLRVNGVAAVSINQPIDQFDQVILDEQVLQDRQPVYLMMYKPVGVVSATRDHKHPTVIDLLDHPCRGDLHIVGRLDFNTSGLLLLSNDGRWSRQLTSPEQKVPKLYRVTLAKPLSTEYITAFAEGMYFPFEGITTRPAKLTIINDYVAEVTLIEGRYHQIKRMFGRFRNPVLKLHRVSIGSLCLDEQMLPGQSRELSISERACN
ncbi:MAG: pseudouridine synthase [Spongiibacteraceae bacterium]